MKKKDVLLIGYGQGGNNIVDSIITESKGRFLGYFINSCADDIFALQGNGNIIDNFFVIPNANGTGRNRDLAKKYTQMHYKTMAENIKQGYLMQKVIYIVFSADGGTGGGGAISFAKVLRTVCPEKIINLVCILPSLALRSKQGKRNVLECWNDIIKSKDKVNTIYFLNNDTRDALDDYSEINKEFAELFNLSFEVAAGSIAGTIDPNDSIKLHYTHGIGVIYTLPDNVKDAKMAIEYAKTSSILAEIDSNKCDYLLVSLKDNSKLKLDDVVDQFDYREEVIDGKNKKHNIVMATGIDLESVKETIQLIQTSLEEDKKIKDIKKNKEQKITDLELSIEIDEDVKERNKNLFNLPTENKTLDDILNDDSIFEDIFK